MKKSQLLVCFLALFGCSLAQSITELTSGTASVGALTPVLTDYDADRQANYYKIWIPGNVKSVKVDLEKTDTVCSYIDYYVSSTKLPCNGQEFSDPTDFSYVCKSAYYSYVGSSTTTQTFVPGDSDSQEIGFATEDWLYVSIGRYASKEDACAYTLTVTLDLCPAGNVGFYDTSIASPYANCLPLDWSLTTAQLPYTATVNLSVDIMQNRVWVPKGASAVRIQIINATDYIYVTGDNRHGVSNSYYTCRDSGGPLSDPIDLWCHFPEEGWFYYTFQFYYSFTAGDSIGFIATVDTVVCDDMHAGFNCSWPMAATSTITAGQTVSLAAYVSGSGGDLVYPSQYFYFDNVNGTSVATNFTVTVTSGSVSIVYRRNGFPGYSSNYYQTSYDYESLSTGSESFALTWEDTWVGGRFYFLIVNSGSTAASVTIASASETVTSGGGSGTTDASTSTTGGAAEVVAPLFLIALLIAALL